MALIAPFIVFIFLFLHLFLLHSVDSKCQNSSYCENVGLLQFPFYNHKYQNCGLFKVDCDCLNPRIQLGDDGERWYDIIKYNVSTNQMKIKDPILQDHLNNQNCHVENLSLPNHISPYTSFTSSNNLTLFICSEDCFRENDLLENDHLNYLSCGVSRMYYNNPTNDFSLCSSIQLPVNPNSNSNDQLFDQLTAEFILEWHVSRECYECHDKGGSCRVDSHNEFVCHEKEKSRTRMIVTATAVSGGGVFIICLLIPFIIWKCKKRIKNAYFLSRNISLDPSSKPDIEGGNYFGIPVFCYSELEEATNHFDPSKVLGDGGFGTVYYGKLRDGREVAIKRLYKHNCRRMEQFINEIKILTSLRHKNLVSLYGCTSRRSKELLLVYEYIPNGTVADHLHGQKIANSSPLTWPVRMDIAIQTARALAYLHKSDIIHRDVKTDNILLDANFCVKVADFGLSRLFPNHVTHISTAPQGTPGYVDPEYHQCYQLTDKSDVYSFGVVLIELISSMPAVDITRHRHEINLANLAVSRIQRCAFDELIDGTIGYKIDDEVTRMTTGVAELAFRCLQLEKEMRPSMDEVLEILMEVKGGGGHEMKFEDKKGDDNYAFGKKKIFHSSPNAVTDVWVSSASTTGLSVG